jgi:predicted TIM-barrel enzyme
MRAESEDVIRALIELIAGRRAAVGEGRVVSLLNVGDTNDITQLCCRNTNTKKEKKEERKTTKMGH